jgi:hypothetical protein
VTTCTCGEAAVTGGLEAVFDADEVSAANAGARQAAASIPKESSNCFMPWILLE